MNTKLINNLSKKWSQPKGLPAKGYELVKGNGGLSPCAQSEAVMLSKGMGVMDFQAFWKGGRSLSRVPGSGINLDKITAKVLGISVIHSVLLRRFNDLSSLNPAIVLNEPERVLGRNWKKVLEFWYFVESLTESQQEELSKVLAKKVNQEEYVSKKRELKALGESLDVITPDLHYLTGHPEPLDTTFVAKVSEDEVLKEIPDFHFPSKLSRQHKPVYIPAFDWLRQYPGDSPSPNNVMIVGDYSRAYFGWIAPYDYFMSNFSLPFPGSVNLSRVQVLVACATNEIQTLSEGQTYEDLYFCKIIGFNPFGNLTLRGIKRKFKESKKSIFEVAGNVYRIVDNTVFSMLSKDENVRQAPTKEMVEGRVKLTKGDILSEQAYGKIVNTYNVGNGRFFGFLTIQVPKLGEDKVANDKFYELTQTLKKDYDVWPLSFCEEEKPELGQISEWAIRSRKELLNYRVNVPKGY